MLNEAQKNRGSSMLGVLQSICEPKLKSEGIDTHIDTIIDTDTRDSR